MTFRTVVSMRLVSPNQTRSSLKLGPDPQCGRPDTDLKSGLLTHWQSHACSVSSCVWLFATLCTVIRQAPPSMGFSRQKYWSGVSFPPPGESSWPRDRTQISCVSFIGRQILYHWATWEASDGAIDLWFIAFFWKEIRRLPEPEARVESSWLSSPGTASLGSGYNFLEVFSHDLPSYHFALQLSFNHTCATFSRLKEILPSFCDRQKLDCYCTSR